MPIHYLFDEPLDVSLFLRGIAHDIESRPTGEFDVAVGALREAAGKIEKAVYDAPKAQGP